MKKLFLTLISLALAGSAYAIPNTFQEGDVISAEKMNENFQALVNSNVLRSKSVNCDDGETINGAIENGYNDITVSGTCNENVDFTVWRDSAVDGRNPNGKLAPRLLKLSSGSTPGVIVDASSNTKSTITVTNGSTLILENISVQGGTHTVYATRNSNLLMTGGVTVGGFTQRGIRIEDSSYLGVDEGGVTITGGTDAERGVYVGMGSSAWIHTSNISNVEQGMTIYGGSYVLLYNFTIEASQRGIAIGDHSTVVRYQDGAGLITGTADRAIDAWQGNFYSWSPGSLTIQNLQGGRGIAVGRGGNSYIANLNMPDFENTGSGWNPAISVDINSTLELENAEISGSTDGALVRIGDGSIMEIRDSTLTIGNATAGIEASGSSRLRFHNSTISGSVTDNLVSVSEGSSLRLENATIAIQTGQMAIYSLGNSHLSMQNSSISGSGNDNGCLVEIVRGSSAQIEDSTIKVDSGVGALRINRNSELRSSNITITGAVSDNLLVVTYGSSATIRESSLSATQSNGIYMSMGASLELRNTNLVAALKGLDANENSSVRVRSGSTITAQDGYAVKARRASGFNIDPNTSINSTGGYALALDENSFTTLSDGSITIDRSDAGPDVNVSSGSVFVIGSGNIIDQISCGSRGFVRLEGSAVVNSLADSCTE